MRIFKTVGLGEAGKFGGGALNYNCECFNCEYFVPGTPYEDRRASPSNARSALLARTLSDCVA